MTRIIIEANSTEEGLQLATALQMIFITPAPLNDGSSIVMELTGVQPAINGEVLTEFLNKFWTKDQA